MKYQTPARIRLGSFPALLCILLLPVFGVRGQHATADTPLQKAFISFRIGTSLYLDDKKYGELIALFNKHKGVTDEITFFTSETHPPLPLDVFRNRMALLKGRMQVARANGYRTGINVLGTIGHHEENLAHSLKGDYTYMTDIHGNVCKGSYCPNDSRFREYVKEIYTEMAKADPDYIWIDDDIRLAGHLPIYLTCFCDNCLEIFGRGYGTKYTRESLQKSINEGDSKNKLPVRKAWLQHNRNTIAGLFRLIEETVHGVRPGLPLGFMTGDRFFEGYDFDNWARVLTGENRAPVFWRPGGGFYQDHTPAQMAGKSHDIGRQVSILPREVVSIQSEIENYTYQRLKKSAYITSLEAASHIAAGCTGAAFNVLTMNNDPLEEYEPLVAELRKMRPFYDLMAAKLGRSGIEGVSSFWNKDSFSGVRLAEGNWFSSSVSLPGYEIDELGIPTSYTAGKASVVKLRRESIAALSEAEIREILSGGVYMDTEALKELNERGFGALTGFEVLNADKKDRIEQLTAHPLNGRFAGIRRDNRQAVYQGEAVALRKTGQGAESLSALADYAGKLAGDCTMGIFENQLGGRICVSGYYPWSEVHTHAKSAQMKAVFRWLSKDRLPGYIDSYHKVNLWIREPQNGKVALAFTNSTFDPARNVVLKLKTPQKTIRLYDMQCKETRLRSSGTDGPYQTFVIPQVDAWQMRLVVTE